MMGIEEKKGLVFDWFYDFVDGTDRMEIISTGETDKEVGLATGETYDYIRKLELEGFVKTLGKDGMVQLEEKGQKLGQNGGYQAHLEKVRKQDKKAENRAQLQDRLLENQVVEIEARIQKQLILKQEAFFVSTTRKNRWYMWVSIASVLISLLALWFSVRG